MNYSESFLYTLYENHNINGMEIKRQYGNIARLLVRKAIPGEKFVCTLLNDTVTFLYSEIDESDRTKDLIHFKTPDDLELITHSEGDINGNIVIWPAGGSWDEWESKHSDGSAKSSKHTPEKTGSLSGTIVQPTRFLPGSIVQFKGGKLLYIVEFVDYVKKSLTLRPLRLGASNNLLTLTDLTDAFEKYKVLSVEDIVKNYIRKGEWALVKNVTKTYYVLIDKVDDDKIYTSCTLVKRGGDIEDVKLDDKVSLIEASMNIYNINQIRPVIIEKELEQIILTLGDNSLFWNQRTRKIENMYSFDSLKPFDRVLARVDSASCWYCDFFDYSRYQQYYLVGSAKFAFNKGHQLVPYDESTKMLPGTTDPAPDQYIAANQYMKLKQTRLFGNPEDKDIGKKQ